MQWIDVEKELPEDEELVCVVAWICSRFYGYLCEERKPWIFLGTYNKSRGWEISLGEKYAPVTHWCRFSFPVLE